MTVEEIIEKQLNITIQDWGYSEVTHSELISLCQEIRELTIEECKKEVMIDTRFKTVDGEKIVKHRKGRITLSAFEKHKTSTYEYKVDKDSFPTDLNNINI